MDPEFKGSNGQNISVTLKILMRHITNAVYQFRFGMCWFKKKGIPIQQPFNLYNWIFLTIFETLNFNKLIVKLINAKTTVRIW